MSAIGNIGNKITTFASNINPLDTDNIKTSKDEENSKDKIGHKPVASMRTPIYDGDDYEPDMHSAEARNVFIDEQQATYLNGHFGAGRITNSVAHDDRYFKNNGKLASSAVDAKNITGYDVNTNEDHSVKVQTHGGQELTDYLTGTSIREGELFIHESGRFLPGFVASSAVEVSNEMVGANLRFGNLMLDGRINFDSDPDGSAFGSKMGDLGNSYMTSGRLLFGSSNLFSGVAGVTLGYAPDMEDGKFLAAFGGHANSHFLDATIPFKNGVSKLKFSVDAQSQMALPFMFGGENSTHMFDNMTLSSLVTNGMEYEIDDQWSFGAKLNANVDLAHSIRKGEAAITSFAEASAVYNGSNFDIGANLYMPLTVYDESFSDKLTWNVQGGYKKHFSGTGADLGVSASVSGNFDSGVSKVSTDVRFGAISAGLSVDGIDNGNLSVGMNAKLDLTGMLLGHLFL